MLARINDYCRRSSEDFDKYKALSLAETLQFTAKSTGHEKAAYYEVVLMSLRERLSVPLEAFRAYFLSLLGDRQYEKVLTTIAKVDKALAPPQARPNSSSGFSREPRSAGSSRPPPRGSLNCYFCGGRGHRVANCWQRQREGNRPRQQGPPQRGYRNNRDNRSSSV